MGEKSPRTGSLEGRGLTIAVIAARYNHDITEKLLEGALAVLAEHGATADPVVWVPGCIELPVTAQAIIETGSADAVVALGCVIKGDTAHFEHVAGQCAAGLMQVSLDSGIPVSFGVLTTYACRPWHGPIRVVRRRRRRWRWRTFFERSAMPRWKPSRDPS